MGILRPKLAYLALSLFLLTSGAAAGTLTTAEKRMIQEIGQAQGTYRNQIALTVETQFKTEALVSNLRKKIPSAGVSVVSRYKGTLIVRLSRTPQPADLQSVRSAEGVLSARLDQTLALQDRTDCPDCRMPPPIHSPEIQGVLEVAPPQQAPCSLSAVCKTTGKIKLWAQEAVDGDLMVEELRKLGVADGAVKVAVIDSGFDAARQGANLLNKKIKFERGTEAAGDPRRDPQGHGTAVAGLFGGKMGIGIAPHADLTLYRVTEEKGGGHTSQEMLAQSILTACDAGNQIINVSWGGAMDELGYLPDEVLQFNLMRKLQEKGCAVFKSSGNAGIKDRLTISAADNDAYIRVASTSRNTDESGFSSRGEISAPGGEVFTLRSQEMDIGADKDSSCGVAGGITISGTSFAAPIAAAIGANVIAVLSLNPQYKGLSGPAKIDLLNKILKESMLSGQLNGLLAVRQAAAWNAGVDAVPEVRESKETACNATKVVSAGLTSCSEKQSCYRDLRKRVALCPSQRQEAYAALTELAAQEKNTELTSYWVDQGNRLGLAPSTKVVAYLEQELLKPRKVLSENADYYRRFRRVTHMRSAVFETWIRKEIANAVKGGQSNLLDTPLFKILSEDGILTGPFLEEILLIPKSDWRVSYLVLDALETAESEVPNASKLAYYIYVGANRRSISGMGALSSEEQASLKKLLTFRAARLPAISKSAVRGMDPLIDQYIQAPERTSEELTAILNVLSKSESQLPHIEKLVRGILTHKNATSKQINSALFDFNILTRGFKTDRNTVLSEISNLAAADDSTQCYVFSVALRESFHGADFATFSERCRKALGGIDGVASLRLIDAVFQTKLLPTSEQKKWLVASLQQNPMEPMFWLTSVPQGLVNGSPLSRSDLLEVVSRVLKKTRNNLMLNFLCINALTSAIEVKNQLTTVELESIRLILKNIELNTPKTEVNTLADLTRLRAQLF